MISPSPGQFISFLSLRDDSTYTNSLKRQNYRDGELLSGCQELGMGMRSLGGCDYQGAAQVGSSVAREPFRIARVVLGAWRTLRGIKSQRIHMQMGTCETW